ncbi:MAG: SDR family oxidoreductase [Chitinophagaceae bacterium]|nr:MAG: SDR family oxidoreductase [Chitinophagaceae bacterium]
MKKRILLFGANSFVAKEFISSCRDRYEVVPVYRNNPAPALNLDFTDSSAIAGFTAALEGTFSDLVFLQGINPSMGVKDITEEHFLRMMKVNLSTPVLLLAAMQDKIETGGSVVMVSSVAKRKGSYDPSYAAAKAGLTGLMLSLANGYPALRFNLVSLGLVEGSPVFNGMTDDFRARHAARMQNGTFIKASNVVSVIAQLIDNENLNRTDIAIDGGYN